jgi:hypothetical protein
MTFPLTSQIGSSLGYSFILAPRPFEELCAESGYLFAEIQKYSVLRKQLYQQYSYIAEQLATFNTPKERRQKRKKLNLLKLKISAAAEQEKRILLRLGEVRMEMDSRETWAQVHETRAGLSSLASPGPTLSSFSAVSDASSNPSSCTTPLNAFSPVFVPKGETRELPPPGPCAWAAETGLELGTVDEATEDLCNHELEYTYRADEETKLLEWDGALMKPRLKRSPSLPGLQFLWPEK